MVELSQSNDAGKLVVQLKGKFTFSDHERFGEILKQLRTGSLSQVTLDFSDVDMVDSSALGMLLVARQEAEKTNAQIILRGMTGQVDKVFTISNFKQLFTCH